MNSNCQCSMSALLSTGHEPDCGRNNQNAAGTPPTAVLDCRFYCKPGTVKDTTTGLTWQRHVGSESFSLDDATQYAASLTLDGGGWRLPTIKELLTIIDFEYALPAVNRGVFPATPLGWFWSSTPGVSHTLSFWIVDFSDGVSAVSYKDNVYSVRCVR